MSSKAVRALYRSFWRTIQGLERQGVEVLDIRTPVNKGGHGVGAGGLCFVPRKGTCWLLVCVSSLVPPCRGVDVPRRQPRVGAPARRIPPRRPQGARPVGG